MAAAEELATRKWYERCAWILAVAWFVASGFSYNHSRVAALVLFVLSFAQAWLAQKLREPKDVQQGRIMVLAGTTVAGMLVAIFLVALVAIWWGILTATLF